MKTDDDLNHMGHNSVVRDGLLTAAQGAAAVLTLLLLQWAFL